MVIVEQYIRVMCIHKGSCMDEHYLDYRHMQRLTKGVNSPDEKKG